MSLPDLDKLTTALQRGTWGVDEEAALEAYLATHPEQRRSWEEEISLTLLLRQTPDVPVSSNFTARVMQAARAEELSPRPEPVSPWRGVGLGHWWPRLAGLTAILCLGWFSHYQHQMAARRELARNLAEVLSPGTTLDVLQNFEAIERLKQVPRDRDKELIAALQ
jgi:anti-sigma factor RsiW